MEKKLKGFRLPPDTKSPGYKAKKEKPAAEKKEKKEVKKKKPTS